MLAQNLIAGDQIRHNDDVVILGKRLERDREGRTVTFALEGFDGEHVFRFDTDPELLSRHGLPVFETPRLTVTLGRKSYGPNDPMSSAIFVSEVEVGKAPAFSQRGEDVELDREWDHYNAQEIDQMTTAAREALGLLVESDLTTWEEAPTLRFSSRAGCKDCPCSSGLVLGSRLTLHDHPGQYDTWVSLKPAFFQEA